MGVWERLTMQLKEEAGEGRRSEEVWEMLTMKLEGRKGERRRKEEV